jgi:multidrug resistance efflux pump
MTVTGPIREAESLLEEPRAEPASAAPRTTPRRRWLTLRRALIVIVPVVLLVAGLLGYSTYREGVLYVATDNAQLAGQPVQVGSMNAGRVETLNVRVGSHIHRGDVLAEVAPPSQTGQVQSGQPRLSFIGPGDSRVEVTAPIDGVVIAIPVAIGASVQPGQPIVALVDPAHLWVNANIDETSVERIKIGQGVEVHLDALNADLPGRVEAITPATAATFSMLPTSTGSGNFTKIAQLVPVRIGIVLQPAGQQSLLGTSAEVKIRVQD